MSAGDLVEGRAVASGMRIVPSGSLIFLRARGATDERLAAARLAQPVVPSQTGMAASTAGAETPPGGSEPATSGAQAPSSTTTQPTPGG
jgi:hypothetical protein